MEKILVMTTAAHQFKQGFTFMELIMVLALFSSITLLSVMSLDPLMARVQVTLSSRQISQALQEAQLLAMTRFRTYQVRIENQQLLIYQTGQPQPYLIWDKLPKTLSYSATRWPSFSPTGFAVGGTIVIESRELQTEIRISPSGRIRAAAIAAPALRILAD